MSARRLVRGALVLLAISIVAVPTYSAKKPVCGIKKAARMAKTAVSGAGPKIDPVALAMLRQSDDYLKGLQSFSVHVETNRDVVSPSSQALTSSQVFDLMVQKPDRFAIKMTSAGGNAQVFYDGKTVTVYNPERNFYAVQPAPPTIAETLKAASKRGLEMPLASLLYREGNQPLTANIQSGIFVGKSLVNGVNANQLAFRGKNVDWQIWLTDDQSAPLPVKVVIVDKRVAGSPRFMANLSDWNTSPTFDASVFTFTPPEGARKINFSQLPKRSGSFPRGTKPAAR